MKKNNNNINRSRLLNSNMVKLVAVFKVVYQTRSLTKATKILLKTKSVISRNISQLEYIFGEKFFERKGCVGLVPTKAGDRFYLYAERIENSYNIVTKKSSNHGENVLKICIHPLGIKYLLSFLKKNNLFKIYIDSKNRDDAFNDFINDEYDILLFPCDNAFISNINDDEIAFDKFLRYEMCLYMHKNNVFANLSDDKISWKILQQMNIVPVNRKMTFDLYFSLLYQQNFLLSLSSLDLFILKFGLEHNLWISGLGKEFMSYINNKNIICKKLDPCNAVTTDIYWYFFYKKNNLNVNYIKNTVLNIKSFK